MENERRRLEVHGMASLTEEKKKKRETLFLGLSQRVKELVSGFFFFFLWLIFVVSSQK